jgi:hypothetical protein
MLKSLPNIPKPDWVPKSGPINYQAYDDWIYGEGNRIYADRHVDRPDGERYPVIGMTRCFVCEYFYLGPCGWSDIVGRFRDSLRVRPYYWICYKCKEKPERPEVLD